MSNAPEVPRRWLVMRWSEGVSDSFVTYNEQVANHYRAEGCWAVEELFTEAEVARLREALDNLGENKVDAAEN